MREGFARASSNKDAVFNCAGRGDVRRLRLRVPAPQWGFASSAVRLSVLGQKSRHPTQTIFYRIISTEREINWCIINDWKSIFKSYKNNMADTKECKQRSVIVMLSWHSIFMKSGVHLTPKEGWGWGRLLSSWHFIIEIHTSVSTNILMCYSVIRELSQTLGKPPSSMMKRTAASRETSCSLFSCWLTTYKGYKVSLYLLTLLK